MSDTFALHPQLEADTYPVCEWPLCRVLLINDCRFPWLVLVPRVDNIREIHHLSDSDQAQLAIETARAASVLEERFAPDKINTGALGNMVEQLHIHVVARSQSDAAWPGPVWGAGTADAYADGLGPSLAADIGDILKGCFPA